MKLRPTLGLLTLMLSACGPTPQWVKPGATEADLQKTISLCDRENIHFGRGRIAHFGLEDETIQPRTYPRGGGEMLREQCLERHGWRLELVDGTAQTLK
jgi:hypothetical protein